MAAVTEVPAIKDKHLRACLLCSIVLTAKEFKRNGCPNCEEISKMRNDGERVELCTSNQFEGMIALVDPKDSWVGRWQRISNFTRGIYAAQVAGTLPEEIQEELQAQGMTYRPRDQNTED